MNHKNTEVIYLRCTRNTETHKIKPQLTVTYQARPGGLHSQLQQKQASFRNDVPRTYLKKHCTGHRLDRKPLVSQVQRSGGHRMVKGTMWRNGKTDCACATTWCHSTNGLRMRHYMMPHYKRTAHASLRDATLRRDCAWDSTWCHPTLYRAHDKWCGKTDVILFWVFYNLIAIRCHWLATFPCTQVVVSQAVFSQNFRSCFSFTRTTFTNIYNS
jgi:hypothetical protein